VVAVLCLLIRHYLRSRGTNKVPSDLKLLWGPHQGNREMRNPSNGNFKFSMLNQSGMTDARRAEVSRLASAILTVATGGSALREIEKSLFMIGFAVRDPWAASLLG
jgi:hypothetical protein